MRCDELQLNISLYDDDSLSDGERSQLDAHLQSCPVCRMRLADTRDVLREIRSLSRPQIPLRTQAMIRAAVAAELGPGSITGSTPIFRRRSWLRAWMLPSMAGGLATIIFGLIFLNAIFVSNRSTSRPPGPMYVEMASNSSSEFAANVVTPSEYARTRLDVSSHSPSINPNGALVALTKSLVRGEMKDDEVVVVAEVFGNGLARVDEIVEPSQNRRAVYELQKALQSDPAFAPFVPANLDGRSESVRVILKIQNVDVHTRLPKNRKL